MDEMIGAADIVEEPVAGRTILAGFEPFDGRQRNRSWELVRRFRDRPETDVFRLPVDFGQLGAMIAGILSRKPRAILMVGESPVNELRVEQLALNVADTDSPDNAGRMPQAEHIVAGGPMALLASWDARGLAGRLHQEGIPATVSFHAGTFACNAALYLALQKTRAGSGAAAVGGSGEEGDGRSGEHVGDRDPRGGLDRVGTAPVDDPAIGFFHIPNSRGPSGLGSSNLSRAVELGIEELLGLGRE